LAKQCSEKYGKRLIGKTDLEDALKRLDKLTRDEVRIGTAEILACVDDRLANVND